MLFHTWEYVKQHAKECYFWRAGTEAALGWPSHGEFMRRLPLAYRGATVAAMREWIAKNAHPMDFNQYVTHEVNVNRNFSESNVMGEWAWIKAPRDYAWVCLDQWQGSFGPAPVIQFWSHGGFDRPRDGDGRLPREIILETLGSL